MTAKSRARKALDWLRAGYPSGVPGPDRVPLLALLRNTPLTEAEINEVVRGIAAAEAGASADHVIDQDEIEKFIEGVAHHDGGSENIQRVADLLAAAGWKVEDLHGE